MTEPQGHDAESLATLEEILRKIQEEHNRLLKAEKEIMEAEVPNLQRAYEAPSAQREQAPEEGGESPK